MVDMRDNMLAADLVRFGGANQDIIWNAFASRGLGQDAATTGADDTDPTPSFASPLANNATVQLRAARRRGRTRCVQLYVGDYEARAMPIADTDPATPLGDTCTLVPGTYDLLVRGDGLRRTCATTLTVKAGQLRTHDQLRENLRVDDQRGDGERRRLRPRRADRRHRGDQLGRSSHRQSPVSR